MSTITKQVVRTVTEERPVRVSDFSGREIPPMHWSAVTNIWCSTSDHGRQTGNVARVFEFDLLPEEMAAFKQDLAALIESHRRKWSALHTNGSR